MMMMMMIMKRQKIMRGLKRQREEAEDNEGA